MASIEFTPSELQIELARNIVEYIKQQGLESGSHITEKELVDKFKVSRSPIRGALTYLVEKEIVEQRSNRGFFACLSSHDLHTKILNFPRTEIEELCISISKDWFEKKIPQSFSEAEFRQHYDLGRLSASRILLKLSQSGIISRKIGHGWQFEPTLSDQKAHDDSYNFRLAIEPAAILTSSFKLDESLANISRLHHKSILSTDTKNASIDKVFDLDAEFHNLIGISSHNSFFQSCIEQQNSLRRLVEYESLIDKDRLVSSCAEHMEILDCLERGQQRKAASLMKRHLEIASKYGPDFFDNEKDNKP